MSATSNMQEMMRMMDAVQRAQTLQREGKELSGEQALGRMRTLCEDQGLLVDDAALALAFEDLYGRSAPSLVPVEGESALPLSRAPVLVTRSPTKNKRPAWWRWLTSIELWLFLAVMFCISAIQLNAQQLHEENSRNHQATDLLDKTLTELRVVSSQVPEIRLDRLKKTLRPELNVWGRQAWVQRLAAGGYRLEYTGVPSRACLLLSGSSKHQLKQVRITHGTVTTPVMTTPGVLNTEALVQACGAAETLTVSMDTRSLGGVDD